MSKLMGRHRPSAQRRAVLACGANVFVQNVFETCSGHGSSFSIYEQLGHWWRSANRHPGTEIGGGLFPKRKASFPPPLAKNANANRSLEGHILQWERHQLRYAQPSSEAEVHHGSVADPQPRSCV